MANITPEQLKKVAEYIGYEACIDNVILSSDVKEYAAIMAKQKQ